jgi:hypothetical protein
MATFLADTVKDISCVEEEGAVVSLTRTGIVEGLTTGTFGALAEAFNATNLPAVNSTPADFPGLRLVKRSPRILAEDNTKAEIVLEYRPYGRDGINLVFSVSSQGTQVQTQKDAYGNPLIVEYEYPADYAIAAYRGKTIQQGATASVFMTQTTLVASGLVNTDYPYTITSFFANSVNALWFSGGAPRTWYCNKCAASPHDMGVSPRLWRFDFEFIHNPIGWDQDYWFTDPNTGQPPPDLVAGTGIKPLQWYAEVHYGAYLRNL